MYDATFELMEEYRKSAECKQVLEYALSVDCIIDSKTLTTKSDAPITAESFTRFCNSMITLHRHTMDRSRPDGVTVTGDGVCVSTVREQGHMTYKVQRAEPLPPSV